MNPAEMVIIRRIGKELAQIFASYGDQPDYLMHKIENLTFEFFLKGAQIERMRNELMIGLMDEKS